MRRAFALTALLGFAVVATACDRAGADRPFDAEREQKPLALPSADTCTRSTGGDEEPRAFDAIALVEGPAVHLGRTVALTICFVPSTAGRAVASLDVVGTGDVRPARTSVEWPKVDARARLVDSVAVDVAAGARATIKTTIDLFDAAGQPSGRYIDSTYVLGGPDAVFASEKSLGELDEVALRHERDAGRITDSEYRRRVKDLRQPGQVEIRESLAP